MFHPTQIEVLATLRRQDRLRAAARRRLVRSLIAPRRVPTVLATFPAARWFGAPVDEVEDGVGPSALRRASHRVPAADPGAERSRRASIRGPEPRCC